MEGCVLVDRGHVYVVRHNQYHTMSFSFPGRGSLDNLPLGLNTPSEMVPSLDLNLATCISLLSQSLISLLLIRPIINTHEEVLSSQVTILSSRRQFVI